MYISKNQERSENKSQETRLTNSIASVFRDKDVQLTREAPYQEYKFGGFVDLFIRKRDSAVTDYLFEVKGNLDREDRGSRQLQKMKNCFHSEWSMKNYLQDSPDYTIYELCIYPSLSNFFHVLDHIDLYESHGESKLDSMTVVKFRHPDHPGIPVNIAGPGKSMRDPTWHKYYKNFPELFDFDIKSQKVVKALKEVKN